MVDPNGLKQTSAPAEVAQARIAKTAPLLKKAQAKLVDAVIELDTELEAS